MNYSKTNRAIVAHNMLDNRSSHKTKPNPSVEKHIKIQILMFCDQLQHKVK